MSDLELIGAYEYEKKNKERKEEEEILEKERQEKLRNFEKQLETSRLKIDLMKLKDLILDWTLPESLLDNILDSKILDSQDIKIIFDKIDEIEFIENIESILPKQLRITKEEYLIALKDPNKRIDLIKKLDNTLEHIYNHLHWSDMFWLNLFSFIYFIFDKNLKKIQENSIDIKNSLIDNDMNK